MRTGNRRPCHLTCMTKQMILNSIVLCKDLKWVVTISADLIPDICLQDTKHGRTRCEKFATNEVVVSCHDGGLINDYAPDFLLLGFERSGEDSNDTCWLKLFCRLICCSLSLSESDKGERSAAIMKKFYISNPSQFTRGVFDWQFDPIVFGVFFQVFD